MDDLTLDGLKDLKRRVDEESDKKDEKIKNLEGLVKQIVACADQVKRDYQQKLESIQVENLQLKEEIEKLKQILRESNNNNNNNNNNNDVCIFSLYKKKDFSDIFVADKCLYLSPKQRRFESNCTILFADETYNLLADNKTGILKLQDGSKKISGTIRLLRPVMFGDVEIIDICSNKNMDKLYEEYGDEQDGCCTFCGKKKSITNIVKGDRRRRYKILKNNVKDFIYSDLKSSNFYSCNSLFKTDAYVVFSPPLQFFLFFLTLPPLLFYVLVY